MASASRASLGRLAARCWAPAKPANLFCPRTSFPALDACRGFGAVATNKELHPRRERPRRLAPLETIPFQDLLCYLHERYGLQDAVVKEPLSELAHILGYKRVDSGTSIQFGDMRILMEEVGGQPATRREFRRFLRQHASEPRVTEQALSLTDFLAEKEGEAEAELEDLEEWYRIQNAKDLLTAVRKCGAAIESLPHGQGWLRVTTPGGAVIRFKQAGRKERQRERPVSDKKIMIRACPETAHPTTDLVCNGFEEEDAGQLVSSVAGPRRRRKGQSRKIKATAVSLRVREPKDTGRGKRHRRRGQSACALHAGNRLWMRKVSAQGHSE